jgi:hypothetical protein
VSNIKQVVIDGWLPFNLNDDPELQRLLGQAPRPVHRLEVDLGRGVHVGAEHQRWCYRDV